MSKTKHRDTKSDGKEKSEKSGKSGKSGKSTKGKKPEPPSDLGECAFQVDSKEITKAVRTLVMSGTFGGGDTDMFGSDGTASALDALLVRVTGDNELQLTYSKLTVYATTTLPCVTYKPGEFVIPSTLFSSVKFAASGVTFVLKSRKLVFKSGSVSGNMQVSGEAADVESNKPEKIKCDLLLTKPFVTDIASKLMYSSFDMSLPSYGLPLQILSRKGRLTLTSSDSICAAMLTRKDDLPDIDLTLPGSALIQIVKALGCDEVKIGANQSQFRVSGGGFSVYHPIGVYEVIPVAEYLKNEVLTQKHDMTVVINAPSLCDALSTSMGINKIAKANNIVDIDFSKGTITYRNDVAKLSTSFEVVSCRGSSVKHTTDGQKLLAFLTPVKIMKTAKILLFDSRLFIFTEDESLVYILPIQ